MDIIVFLVCMSFMFICLMLGRRWGLFHIFGVVFGILLTVAVGQGGLSQAVGYADSAVVTQSFDVGVVLLFPIFMTMANAFMLIYDFR